MHRVWSTKTAPEPFNRMRWKTVMRIPNYLINSLTRPDRNLILAPTPTNARTLNSLVPLFLSLLLSYGKLGFGTYTENTGKRAWPIWACSPLLRPYLWTGSCSAGQNRWVTTGICFPSNSESTTSFYKRFVPTIINHHSSRYRGVLKFGRVTLWDKWITLPKFQTSSSKFTFW